MHEWNQKTVRDSDEFKEQWSVERALRGGHLQVNTFKYTTVNFNEYKFTWNV